MSVSCADIPQQGGDKHWIYFLVVDQNTGNVIAMNGARAKLVEYVSGKFTFYCDLLVDPTKEQAYVNVPIVQEMDVSRPVGANPFLAGRWPVFPNQMGSGLLTWDCQRKIGTAGIGLEIDTSDGSNTIVVEQYIDTHYQFPLSG